MLSKLFSILLLLHKTIRFQYRDSETVTHIRYFSQRDFVQFHENELILLKINLETHKLGLFLPAQICRIYMAGISLVSTLHSN